MEDERIIAPEGVEISMVEGSLTGKGAELLAVNSTDMLLELDDRYIVQEYKNQRWIDVPYGEPDEVIAWDLTLKRVEERSELRFPIKWRTKYDDGLPQGRYRLIYSIRLRSMMENGQHDRGTRHYIAVEFEIK